MEFARLTWTRIRAIRVLIVCERTQESNVEKLSIEPGNGCFEEPGEMSESVTCLV